jgi:hypothetical protein
LIQEVKAAVKQFIANNRKFCFGIVWLVSPLFPLIMVPWIGALFILCAFIWPFYYGELYQMLGGFAYAVISGEIFNFRYHVIYPGDEVNNMSRIFLKGAILIPGSLWVTMLPGRGICKLTANCKAWQRTLGTLITAVLFWFPLSVAFSLFYMASQYIWSMGFTWKRFLGISYGLGE